MTAPELEVVGEARLDALLAEERPVLVELQSPWCGSCKRMAPAIRSVAAELAGQVEVVLVDIDETPRLSRRFDIPGVPTTILLVAGERVRHDRRCPQRARSPRRGQDLAQGFSTTLRQLSSFCWKTRYISGACSSGTRCVARCSSPRTSSWASATSRSSSVQRRTWH